MQQKGVTDQLNISAFQWDHHRYIRAAHDFFEDIQRFDIRAT